MCSSLGRATRNRRSDRSLVGERGSDGAWCVTRWDEGVFAPYLPADLVLRQAEVGVIAADRQGNVLFVNEHAARLLRLPGDAGKLAGQPLVTIGFIPEC